MRKIRVALADDLPEVRDAVADLLRTDRSLELVAVAEDAPGAVRAAIEYAPDVFLMDVKMPGGGGARAAREISAASPRTKVVAFSAYDDRSTILEMLQAGAVGYVLKGSPAEEIVDAIRAAVEGLSVISPAISREVVEELTARLQAQTNEEESRRERLGRIQQILSDRGLQMVYQPIVALRTGRLAGLEALARFHVEPARPPDAWFSEAASVGMGVELEMAAVRQALARMEELPEAVFLSLNLSPEALVSEAFAELVEGLDAERLVVEVTEHAPVEDYEAVERALAGLRPKGGRLAIDDAGAGFASLRHILRLGPDVIKLDMALTRNIDRDRARRALASALISFAEEMGQTIVAEGIETLSELNTLQGLGVELGQGYFLARPAPFETAVMAGAPDPTPSLRQ